jgi:stage II sporulation protein M
MSTEVQPMKWQQFIIYLRQIKHYLFVSIIVLATGVYLGYVYSDLFHGLLMAQLDRMKGIVGDIAQGDHQQWRLFGFILWNNLRVCFLIVLLGAAFGIMPLFFLISNGMIIGYLASLKMNGGTWFYFIKGIVPHGIIEIPAMILACAYGLRLGFLMLEGMISH